MVVLQSTLARRAAALILICLGAASAAFGANVHLVLDINQTVATGSTATADSNPYDFTDFDGRLFFTADDGVHGRQLWQSDGTATGTRMITGGGLRQTAAGSDPHSLIAGSGFLLFFAYDEDGTPRLWRLTSASKTPVLMMMLDPATQAANLNNKVYFISGYQLWAIDGTAREPTRIDNWSPPARVTALLVYNGSLYFADTDAQADPTVWAVDGTTQATHVAATQYPVKGGPVYPLEGALYYQDDTAGRAFPGVWRWDVASGVAGQILYSHPLDKPIFGTNYVHLLGVTNGYLLASNSYSNPTSDPTRYLSGTELLYTKGVPGSDGTLQDIVYLPNANRVTEPLVESSHTFFVGYSDDQHKGLASWLTDGTAAGTHIIGNAPAGGFSDIGWFADYHGTTLFRAVDPSVGPQLWRTDGTDSGTTLVSNIPPDSTFVNPGRVNLPAEGAGGPDFYFASHDPNLGNELYVYADDAPLAADQSGNSPDGSAVKIDVLAKATDSDGTVDHASVKIATAPVHGTATAGQDGSITYTPSPGYSGTDTFTYTVADDLGKPSAPATVTVTTTAAAPVASGKSGGGSILGQDLVVLLALLAGRGLAGVRPAGRSRRGCSPT